MRVATLERQLPIGRPARPLILPSSPAHVVARRAGARKSGREGGEVRIVKPEDRVDHMPHTQPYPVEDVLVDLLEVSAGSKTPPPPLGDKEALLRGYTGSARESVRLSPV